MGDCALRRTLFESETFHATLREQSMFVDDASNDVADSSQWCARIGNAAYHGSRKAGSFGASR